MTKDKCNIGNSCGRSCISQAKTCNIDFPAKVGDYLDSKVELPGMAAYFTSDYPAMNRYFYDPESRGDLDPSIEAKALAAQSEIGRLPHADEAELQARYAEKGVFYDGQHLYRGMDFQDPDQMIAFLSNHEEGDEIVYAGFTSTTVANPTMDGGRLDGGWANKNVQIEIEHLPLAQSEAKHVDDLKKKKDEGELLYPPGQKFRVKKVEVLEEEERLPPRLRDPLREVFLSEKDGYGVPNLPLKAILGDKEPMAITQDPEYEWFRNLLKKRGLPPVEEWTPDMKVGDLYSKSKLKGGKVAFFNAAEKALRPQVKLEEANGQMDPKKVRIVLKELPND